MREEPGLWEKTKEVTSDIWEGTKEFTGNLWEGTKEVTGDVWDGTKHVAGNVKEAIVGDDDEEPVKTAKRPRKRKLKQ